MGIAASDQRAIRGQFDTMARPGTKKMNTSASTVRATPTRSRWMIAISDTVTTTARRSVSSAHCATGYPVRGDRLDIPQVWTSIQFRSNWPPTTSPRRQGTRAPVQAGDQLQLPVRTARTVRTVRTVSDATGVRPGTCGTGDSLDADHRRVLETIKTTKR